MTISSQSKSPPMLVPLLLGGGVLTRNELEEAKNIATELNLSLEEALVRSGIADKEKLDAPTEALKQVEEKKISLDLAIRAVRLVGQKKVSLDEAVKSIEKVHHQTHIVVSAANELTQLLLSAKMLSREDLGDAIKKSQEASMMIGQYLVLEEKVTVGGLIAALKGVLMIRDSNLDKERRRRDSGMQTSARLPLNRRFSSSDFLFILIAKPPESVSCLTWLDC